ncbi:MAG: hypothetical protein ACREEK_09770 [Bradyrhizobium sp.]|jgi:hypothetical protein
MAKKKVLAKRIPKDEVKDIEDAFEALGATDIKKVKQADGTFNLEGTFPD